MTVLDKKLESKRIIVYRGRGSLAGVCQKVLQKYPKKGYFQVIAEILSIVNPTCVS